MRHKAVYRTTSELLTSQLADSWIVPDGSIAPPLGALSVQPESPRSVGEVIHSDDSCVDSQTIVNAQTTETATWYTQRHFGVATTVPFLLQTPAFCITMNVSAVLQACSQQG